MRLQGLRALYLSAPATAGVLLDRQKREWNSLYHERVDEGLLAHGKLFHPGHCHSKPGSKASCSAASILTTMGFGRNNFLRRNSGVTVVPLMRQPERETHHPNNLITPASGHRGAKV